MRLNDIPDIRKRIFALGGYPAGRSDHRQNAVFRHVGTCMFISIFAICLPATGYSQDSGVPYGEWRAVEIGGAATAEGMESTLTLSEDGGAYGSGACNRFRAEADTGEEALTLGPIAGTMMLCPDAKMQQERRFLKALSSTVRWEIRNGALILYDEAGGTAARLEPADN